MKKYLVIGLGKTGISCIDFLLQNRQYVVTADTRTDPSSLERVKKDILN